MFAVLLIAGSLLTRTNSFIDSQVQGQLSEQHITMPTSQTGLAQLPAADRCALQKYAGQQLTTGPQAKAYANHFIRVHLNELASGQTYSQVSGQYIAQCSDPKKAATRRRQRPEEGSDPKKAATAACQTLGGQRQTLFRGNTLRGLLLYGYAFATIGTIAGYAAIVAFAAAALLLVLVGLGFRHARRAGTYVAAVTPPVGAQCDTVVHREVGVSGRRPFERRPGAAP